MNDYSKFIAPERRSVPTPRNMVENGKCVFGTFDKEFETMAQNYRMEKDKLIELVGDKEKEQIKMDIAVQKAVDFVRDAAKEK